MKDILAVVGFPKATYMYWQKRFDRIDPNKELEEKILAIHNQHKDFGYVGCRLSFEKKEAMLIKRKFRGLCKNSAYK